MHLFFEIVKNDLKLIFRDKSLVVMFIMPVVIVLLCRYGIPQLTAFVPVLPSYYWLLVTALTLVTASTPSYLFGFILLDERDENVHTVLHVLPVPKNFILKIRAGFTVLIGFIMALFVLSLNGLIGIRILPVLLISLLFALVPPVLMFSITAFAKNKIEAATLYKGLNIILFVPVIAFFVNGELRYLFGIIPFFWTFETVHLTTLSFQFVISFLLAFVTHVLLIWLLYKIYIRRNS
jgi:fluoroquinolone transport system permease protein